MEAGAGGRRGGGWVRLCFELIRGEDTRWKIRIWAELRLYLTPKGPCTKTDHKILIALKMLASNGLFNTLSQPLVSFIIMDFNAKCP